MNSTPQCAAKLSTGIAAISKAIETGDIRKSEIFNNICARCPENLPQNEYDAVIDTIDDRVVCQVMCCCKDDKRTPEDKPDEEPRKAAQICAHETFGGADKLTGFTSRYKSEISYDTTVKPPRPLMHRDKEERVFTEPSRYWLGQAKEIKGYWDPDYERIGKNGEIIKGRRNPDAKGFVRRPDIIIVKDPQKPPSQDNIRRVVELKFKGDKEIKGDNLAESQFNAYKRIAGRHNNFNVFTEGPGSKEGNEKPCICDGDGDQQNNPIPITDPEREYDTDADWYDLALWGGATVVGAVATVALLISPFEGPAGEVAAGTATVAAAGRFSHAWRMIF